MIQTIQSYIMMSIYIYMYVHKRHTLREKTLYTICEKIANLVRVCVEMHAEVHSFEEVYITS